MNIQELKSLKENIKTVIYSHIDGLFERFESSSKEEPEITEENKNHPLMM